MRDLVWLVSGLKPSQQAEKIRKICVRDYLCMRQQQGEKNMAYSSKFLCLYPVEIIRKFVQIEIVLLHVIGGVRDTQVSRVISKKSEIV